MQDLYHLVVMSTQNGKDADTQTVKPNKGSETDNEKEKEKEELEALMWNQQMEVREEVADKKLLFIVLSKGIASTNTPSISKMIPFIFHKY